MSCLSDVKATQGVFVIPGGSVTSPMSDCDIGDSRYTFNLHMFSIALYFKQHFGLNMMLGARLCSCVTLAIRKGLMPVVCVTAYQSGYMTCRRPCIFDGPNNSLS